MIDQQEIMNFVKLEMHLDPIILFHVRVFSGVPPYILWAYHNVLMLKSLLN